MAHNFKLNISASPHRIKPVKRFRALGHLLFSERVFQGLSLYTVSKELNLSSYVLKDIEKGNLYAPPGYSYMLGFVRTYAQYLGLNYKDFLEYLPAVDSNFFENETPLVVPPSVRHLPSRKTILMTSFVFLLLCVYPLFYFNKTNHSQLNLKDALPTPSVSVMQKAEPKPIATSDFKLCFTGPAWISLKDNHGKTIKEGTLNKGEEITLPANFKGKMHTGDAGNVYVSYNKQNSKFLGKPGEVIHNFSVDLKNILQNHSNLANN